LLRRKFEVCVLVTLFLLTAFPTGLSILNVGAQTSSCPANLTLRGAYLGGPISALSSIYAGAPIGAGGSLTYLLYKSMYPPFAPSGALDYNESILDWYTVNANSTVWTVNVAPGMKWADGTPITSQDILTTYGNKFAFNASYDFTGDHAEVKSEVALNSSAVQFTLTKPDAAFLFTISGQVYVDVYPAEAIQNPNSNFLNNTATSGPFYPVGYHTGDTSMKLLRNPNFTPTPRPCELDLVFPESTATVASLLVSGSIDYGPIDQGSVSTLLSHPNIQIVDEKAINMLPLQFNTTLYPFNETQFRQGIVFAVNQSQIVQQAEFGYGETSYNAEGTVPSVFSSVYDANQPQYSYNTTKALQLFAASGVTKGSDGLLHYQNGTAVTLSMWVNTDTTIDVLVGNVIQQNLQKLGFTVNVNGAKRGVIDGFTSLAPGQITLVDAGGAVFPSAISDALPGWDVYTHPPIVQHYWMWPPSANTNYYGNLSIIQATTDPAQVKTAIDNIQNLSATYLPVIELTNYDYLTGINTARWTHWPTYPSSWFWFGPAEDPVKYSEIVPTNGTASGSSTSVSSTPSALTTSSVPATLSSSSTNPVVNSTSSTTVSSSSSYLVIAAIVVILVIVAAAVLAMRRRPKGK